ncbi:MAG: PQQ-binding-like beta-propeller repeat protein [bacterium]|nr:PQQ-binding-like beta-propeller repeat protein [bacterium]
MLRTLVPFALLVLCLAPASADWPHLRGPAFDGRLDAPGTFDAEGFGLQVAWSVPIGSSYAGVVVSGDRAVTLFADGDSDWVAALDVEDGKELWRRKLGVITKGHDGSDDGPLSSPVIGDGRVYALAPGGRLVAVKLSDGKVVWEKNLAEQFGGVPPDFGFTTTPLFDGRRLIVQAGGTGGHSIVALDARSGRTVWTHGDAKVDYQSPSLMTLADRQQVVAVAKGTIFALASDSGDVLWTHDLGEEAWVGSASPVFVGDDRFLVRIGRMAAVFSVTRGDGKLQVAQLYRSDVLGGRGYASPVYHDGHVYGFRGGVLSCMRASDGERVWRSRPPGGDGLIVVDGHLVVFGAKGVVAVARATPEGYEERARVQALEGSSLTWPSFDDGRIFVRNLEALTAIEISGPPSFAAAGAAASEGEHAFGRWLKSVEASDNPQEMVEEFLRDKRGPVVEGRYLHFVLRSEASDVGIAGSMNDAEGAEPMEHLDRTDLYYRTYEVEPGGRWEYRFHVGFEEWSTDPKNSHSVASVDGDDRLSELVTPGYEKSSYGGVRHPGTVEELKLDSKILGYEKNVTVWLPPEYKKAHAHYGLLIVNDGKNWIERGNMVNVLNTVAGSTRCQPIVVAFVDAYDEWWTEAGGSRVADYARMQAEELVPMLTEKYRLMEDPSFRAVLGNRYFAISAAYAALAHPDVFGGVAMQSAFLGLGAERDVARLLQRGAPKSLRVYLDWSRYDERNIDRGWDAREDSETLAGWLRDAGAALSGGEALDSYGWGGWSNRAGDALAALFPR